MLSKADKRLKVLERQLSHKKSIEQNSTSQEIAESYLPTLKKDHHELTQEDVVTITENYVFRHHIDLRKKLFKYLEEHRDLLEREYDGMQTTHEEFKLQTHKDLVQIISQNFVTGRDLIKDPLKMLAFVECCLIDMSTAVKLSVHYNLYGAMIAYLGTPEIHHHLLDDMDKENAIGCFMMSELYHASNLKKLGTQAIYQPHKNNFKLHTPNDKHQKFWIGNGSVSATYAIVFAQLIDENGVDQGLHPFHIRIRDENMNVIDGVFIKDVGLKGGLNGTDNCRAWFDNYEVPVNSLLNRYASIVDKKYTSSVSNPNTRFAKHIGALLLARIGVGSGGTVYGKIGLKIAIDYAFKRRQFGEDNSDIEYPIMTYPTHQKRLLPLLAQAYTHHFFQNYVKDQYREWIQNPSNDAQLKKVHLLACCTKVAISRSGVDTLQECREACGGQGFLVRNMIVAMRKDADINVSLDGDNTLLRQQIAFILLGDYSSALKQRNSLMQTLLLSYESIADKIGNGLLFSSYNTNSDHIRSLNFILNALEFRKQKILHSLAKRMYNAITNDGLTLFQAVLRVQLHAVTLSQAYIEYVSMKSFEYTIYEIKRNKDESKNIKRVLGLLLSLEGLRYIERDPWFLQNQVLSSSKHKQIRKEIEKLIREVCPHSQALVQAFGLPDWPFNDSIASSTQELVKINAKWKSPK
mmetsp:Transcript_3678/g.5437  ORF Transcript_3678/g.5437 Transcript_3678/m.5437 type:complete len:691 (-) Transcript_3678:30-2102(-)